MKPESKPEPVKKKREIFVTSDRAAFDAALIAFARDLAESLDLARKESGTPADGETLPDSPG